MSEPGTPSIPPASYRYADDFAVGTVCVDLQDRESGLRGLVIRGPYSFCGYVGAPENHALYELAELEFRCHFGITYRGPGSELNDTLQGWYFFGWDYAHCTDQLSSPELRSAIARLGLEQEIPEALKRLMGASASPLARAKRWSVEEVTEDLLDALLELRYALAESESHAQALREGARSPRG